MPYGLWHFRCNWTDPCTFLGTFPLISPLLASISSGSLPPPFLLCCRNQQKNHRPGYRYFVFPYCHSVSVPVLSVLSKMCVVRRAVCFWPSRCPISDQFSVGLPSPIGFETSTIYFCFASFPISEMDPLLELRGSRPQDKFIDKRVGVLTLF